MRNTKEDVQRLHLMLWDMWGFLIVLLIEIHTEKTWADGPVVMGLKAQQVVLNPFFFNKKKLFPNFIVIFAVILVSWILMWLQLIAVVLTPFFLIDFSINFAARVSKCGQVILVWIFFHILIFLLIISIDFVSLIHSFCCELFSWYDVWMIRSRIYEDATDSIFGITVCESSGNGNYWW